jgi:hypothetical protein
MLDRRLLPENQIQSVEENIYSELNISRATPSNENTATDFSRITNNNLNVSENTNDNFNISRTLDDISRYPLSGTGGAVLIPALAVALGKSHTPPVAPPSSGSMSSRLM